MSSSTSNSQPTLPTLASRLVGIRQKLIGRRMYLGHDSIRENVKWQRFGHTNHVVEMQSKSLSADEKSGNSEDEEGSPSSSESPASTSDGFEIASLSAIVKISNSGFYLTSDGNYRPGQGNVFKRLADVRPSCLCEAPTIEPFKSDFERLVGNLRWLQREATTPGFKQKMGLFPATANGFKVRHVLFDEKSTAAGNNEDSDEFADGEEASRYTIENWPVNQAAQHELDEMRETHIVVPIPAYDMSGELINPRNYRSRLEGALVEIEFGLLHWSIGAKRGLEGGKTEPVDAYVADLQRIWVIAPPTAVPLASPKKRKVPDTIDVNLDVSPLKKRA